MSSAAETKPASTSALSVGGDSTTVDTQKMLGLCVKVREGGLMGGKECLKSSVCNKGAVTYFNCIYNSSQHLQTLHHTLRN